MRTRSNAHTHIFRTYFIPFSDLGDFFLLPAPLLCEKRSSDGATAFEDMPIPLLSARIFFWRFFSLLVFFYFFLVLGVFYFRPWVLGRCRYAYKWADGRSRGAIWICRIPHLWGEGGLGSASFQFRHFCRYETSSCLLRPASPHIYTISN